MIPAALHDAITALGMTPGMIAPLINGLTDDQLRLKHSPDEFSALENICHLRDIEVEAYTPRIARILAETNPLLPDVDGGRLAAEREYNQEDPSEALDSFRLARQNNVQHLRALGGEQIDRVGTLEGVGVISIQKLLEMMQEHDESHVRDLEIICRRCARTSAQSES